MQSSCYSMSTVEHEGNDANLAYFHHQIVLEYCAGGSLYDLLHTLGQPFSEEVVQLIVAHVLIGLETLHKQKFAHKVTLLICTFSLLSFLMRRDIVSND